jgi:hypothetical protein
MPINQSPSKSRNDSTKLSYYIWEGLLVGLLAGKTIEISAVNGGGSMGAKPPAETANNPYSTGVKTTGKKHAANHVHGGPIPPGLYTIRTPGMYTPKDEDPKKVRFMAAQLDRQGNFKIRDGGFLIHGAYGAHPHGSDGCIVPRKKDDFDKLIVGLSVSKGGTLIVAETMSGDRFA